MTLQEAGAPDSLTRFESRLISLWVPASLLISLVPAIPLLPEGIGDRYLQVAYPALTLAAMAVLAFAATKRKTPTLRVFLTLLFFYLAFTFLGELTNSVLEAMVGCENVVVPSLADVFWLTAYPFLLAGGLFISYFYRGFRLPSKAVLVLSGWFLAGIALIAYLVVSLEHSLKEGTIDPNQAAVLLAYPVFDVLIITVLIVVASLYFTRRARMYWTVLLAAVALTAAADISWAPVRNECPPASHPSNVLYLLSYSVFILGAALTLMFVSEESGGGLAVEAKVAALESRVRKLVRRGGMHSAAIALFFITFIGIETAVEERLIDFGPFAAQHTASGFAIALLISLVSHIQLAKVEERRKSVEVYREQFESVLKDLEVTASERIVLDRLRDTLRLTKEEVRVIEDDVLRSEEEKLRAREEEFRRQMLEAAKTERWESSMNARLAELRDRRKAYDAVEASLREVGEEMPPASRPPR